MGNVDTYFFKFKFINRGIYVLKMGDGFWLFHIFTGKNVL